MALGLGVGLTVGGGASSLIPMMYGAQTSGNRDRVQIQVSKIDSNKIPAGKYTIVGIVGCEGTTPSMSGVQYYADGMSDFISTTFETITVQAGTAFRISANSIKIITSAVEFKANITLTAATSDLVVMPILSSNASAVLAGMLVGFKA